MQRSLCISITFLLGRFHGRTLGDRAAEWPPSPLRLFQTLVATAHRGRGEAALPNAEEAALRWLESLCERDPPTIVAKSSSKATPYVIAVPNNDLDVWARPVAAGREPKKQPNELRTMKTVRPTAILDEQIEPADDDVTIRFIWPISVSDADEHADPFMTIRRLARRIVSVGWGLDLVAADARLLKEREVNEMCGTRWRPRMPIGHSPLDRPLPITGTLAALRLRHTRWLGRVNSKSKQYDDVPPYVELDGDDAPRAFRAYEPSSALPTRPFAAFILRPVNDNGAGGFAAFPPERAVHVAAMLRHAACEAARHDLDPDGWRTPDWSLRFVAGHGPQGMPKRRDKFDSHGRFSYLPVPSMGHAHADGMIRRVMIAEPFDGDGRSAGWAARRLAGAMLNDEQRGSVARLEPVEFDEAEFGKVFGLYASRSAADAATTWVSVTPVILPGFDDNDPSKRERLVLACLQHAGIDPAAVALIETRRAAWSPRHGGALAARHDAFVRPGYLKHLPAIHVRLTFASPVAGPVSIGAGRHCGLGVMASSDYAKR